MKIVGKYKDRDVRITDIYICETYGTHLLLSENYLESANQDILSKNVPNTASRLFGDWVPLCIAGIEQIDLKKWMPGVMAYAWLVGAPIEESRFDGSHLVLVWLQDTAEGFFERAESHLKQIAWEEKAKDYEF